MALLSTLEHLLTTQESQKIFSRFVNSFRVFFREELKSPHGYITQKKDFPSKLPEKTKTKNSADSKVSRQFTLTTLQLMLPVQLDISASL